MTGMPGAQTLRKVKVTANVRAVVTATVTISDEQVREWLNIGPDDEIDWESVEEFALEETDESLFALHDIETWDSTQVELLGTERRHVAPPEFVPLPGMEGM